MSGPTRKIATFVAELRYEDLPPDVLAQAGRIVLDAVGCAFAAAQATSRKAAIAYSFAAQFSSGAQHSPVIGGVDTHPAIAAFANGFLINAADHDDTHKRTLIHSGSVLVPAALSLVLARGGTGRDLICAIVAGYEVSSRIGLAVMPTHYRLWHSTATNGTFGAAAAAAKALKFDAERVDTALGFAGTQAAGLNMFFESRDDSKSVNPGKSAMNGVMAALLAELGASSPAAILEHEKGYLAAFSDDPHPEALVEGLGARWEVLENGFKLYPSMLATHSPIGAALEIVATHAPDPSRITRIEVATYRTLRSDLSSTDISTDMAARLSVPFCVSTALATGTLDEASFSKARRSDPAILSLMARTTVVPDPDLTALYPEKFPARVSVTLDDGTECVATCLYPRGDPRNPLSDDELEDKFLRGAMPILGLDRARALMTELSRLGDLDDLATIAGLLRGRAGEDL